MAKKNSNIGTFITVLVVGIAGFWGYNKFIKKTPEPGAEPTPEPMPEPIKPTPGKKTVVSKATAAQIKRLQDVLISLFSKYNGNSINQIKYTASEAAGGWGNKSESALKVALSASTGTSAYTEPLNASNVERYINAVTKVNEIRAKDLKTQQTKQTDSAQRKKTAAEIVKLLTTGNYKAKLLVDVNAPALQFDSVKNTYRSLDSTRKFSKGETFGKSDLTDRGDGTVLFVSGLKRYPINPDNLLTYKA